MARITVDPATEAKLKDLQTAIELCDSAGHVFGHFLPVLDKSRANGRDPQISEEEIQQRLREGGGRPLADILADLEKLA